MTSTPNDTRPSRGQQKRRTRLTEETPGTSRTKRRKTSPVFRSLDSSTSDVAMDLVVDSVIENVSSYKTETEAKIFWVGRGE